MRTTITLSDDVARAVEELRRSAGIGVSAAVNDLVRRGLAGHPPARPPFRQTTSRLGEALVPLDDVAAALDVLEGDARRE